MQLSLNCLYTRKALCSCEEKTSARSPQWFSRAVEALGLLSCCRGPRAGPGQPRALPSGAGRCCQRRPFAPAGRSGAVFGGLMAPGRHCPQPQVPALSAMATLCESWGWSPRSWAAGLQWALPAEAASCSPQARPLPPGPSSAEPRDKCGKQFVHLVSNLSETKQVVLDFKGVLWESSCCVVIREAAVRAVRAVLCRARCSPADSVLTQILTEFSVSPRILGL